MLNIREVIIVGSGPAGLTSAIYTSRAELKPLLISGNVAGGQLMITTEVDNFPGFPTGIMGPELISNMRKQAERFGTEFVTADVSKVDFSKKPFTIYLDNGTEYKSKSLIIATGASARLLNIPSEKEFMGYGVSACATCDGFFFKDKEVIVVGGGDSAMEEALFLTKFASKVNIVHRRDKLRASKIMQDKVTKNPKINFIWNSVIKEIFGKIEEKNKIKTKKVTGVKLLNKVNNKLIEMKIDGIFMAIGHIPNTIIFKDHIELDEKAYIKVKNGTYTSKEGVFACGDVMDSYYKQAITAAGTGCQAAIDVEQWLESQA